MLFKADRIIRIFTSCEVPIEILSLEYCNDPKFSGR